MENGGFGSTFAQAPPSPCPPWRVAMGGNLEEVTTANSPARPGPERRRGCDFAWRMGGSVAAPQRPSRSPAQSLPRRPPLSPKVSSAARGCPPPTRGGRHRSSDFLFRKSKLAHFGPGGPRLRWPFRSSGHPCALHAHRLDFWPSIGGTTAITGAIESVSVTARIGTDRPYGGQGRRRPKKLEFAPRLCVSSLRIGPIKRSKRTLCRGAMLIFSVYFQL